MEIQAVSQASSKLFDRLRAEIRVCYYNISTEEGTNRQSREQFSSLLNLACAIHAQGRPVILNGFDSDRATDWARLYFKPIALSPSKGEWALTSSARMELIFYRAGSLMEDAVMGMQ